MHFWLRAEGWVSAGARRVEIGGRRLGGVARSGGIYCGVFIKSFLKHGVESIWEVVERVSKRGILRKERWSGRSDLSQIQDAVRLTNCLAFRGEPVSPVVALACSEGKSHAGQPRRSLLLGEVALFRDLPSTAIADIAHPVRKWWSLPKCRIVYARGTIPDSTM